MSSKNICIICVIAILISGCQSQSVAATSPTENATPVTIPTSTPVTTATAIETVIATGVSSIPEQTLFFVSSQSCADANGQMPALSNLEIEFNLGPENGTLGGGMVQSNEFTIELYLYCDENFQSDAKEQYYFSDIGGLAIYYNWRYDGPNVDAGVTGGRTFTFYGIDTDIQLRYGEGGGGQRQGHVSQGRPTGILFPPGMIPDFSEKDSLRFIYVMESPTGNLSGAELTFDLQQVSDGLQPGNIEITPLSDTELEALEYVKKWCSEIS